MRTIKFRGKRLDGDNWQYGSLIIHDDGSMAITQGATKFGGQLCSTQIIPESVGMYLNRKDKNGKEVYVGDIINACKIHYSAYAWYTFTIESYEDYYKLDDADIFKVIGNTIDGENR